MCGHDFCLLIAFSRFAHFCSSIPLCTCQFNSVASMLKMGPAGAEKGITIRVWRMDVQTKSHKLIAGRFGHCGSCHWLSFFPSLRPGSIMGEAQCKQVLCEQVLPCVFNLRTLWQMHAVKGHDGSFVINFCSGWQDQITLSVGDACQIDAKHAVEYET